MSVVNGSNGIVKVTGVGRSNDIPNDLDVVGDVTVGDTVISQTNAKLANVDQNVVMITDGASAVSSLSGASGSIVYFENEPPEPGLKTFANILSNENYTIQPGETYVQSVEGQTPDGTGEVSLTTDNIDEGTNAARKYIDSTEKTKLSNITLEGSVNLDSIPAENLAQTYIQDAAGTVDSTNLAGCRS